MRILVTGGAGFIGRHLSRALLAEGYEVRILDCFIEQVHGGAAVPDPVLNSVEVINGDIRDEEVVSRAVGGVDKVVHLAAEVGVGQSMYEIERYTDVNNRGTAVLLEALVKNPVRRLVVASSMSIYGEGLYRDPSGTIVAPPERTLAQLRNAEWELRRDNYELQPLPTPESKTASPSSVYALSKYDQEKLCLLIGQAYNIPTVALRFFNIYGTRQALSNPYTGVLANFGARLLNGQPPLVFEDGRQHRDFVHVGDIAQAFRASADEDE